jgi:hypothetical protein
MTTDDVVVDVSQDWVLACDVQQRNPVSALRSERIETRAVRMAYGQPG